MSDQHPLKSFITYSLCYTADDLMSWLNRGFPDICSLCVMQLCGGLKNTFVCQCVWCTSFSDMFIPACTHCIYMFEWHQQSLPNVTYATYKIKQQWLCRWDQHFIWVEAPARQFGLNAATTASCRDMLAPSPGFPQHTKSFVSIACDFMFMFFKWKLASCPYTCLSSVTHLKLNCPSAQLSLWLLFCLVKTTSVMPDPPLGPLLYIL